MSRPAAAIAFLILSLVFTEVCLGQFFSLPDSAGLPELPSNPIQLPEPLQQVIDDVPLPNPVEWTTTESNTSQVVRDVEDGWSGATSLVAWGALIDHQQEKLAVEAVAASIATENPGPAIAYLKGLAILQEQALQKSLQGEFGRLGRHFRQEHIAQLLYEIIRYGRPKEFQIEEFQIQVGIAAFNNWKDVSAHYPRIDRGSLKWELHEQRINLPNTFRPYIRARFIFGSSTFGPGTSGHFTTWSYGPNSLNSGGYFQKNGQDWLEYQSGRLHAQFREITQTGDVVEIYDGSRSMTVRLDSGRAYWRVGSGQWNYLYDRAH